MFLLLYFGKSFGVSSNLRTICSFWGAGKHCSYFNFNWKQEIWNLIFMVGAVLGAVLASTVFANTDPIQLSESTIANLESLGMNNPGAHYLPASIFSWEALIHWKGILFIVVGGFMVGFGARYAGGCTSGHAISGLSNLQLPSLLAVIGFFIGGLFITHLVLPYILPL